MNCRRKFGHWQRYSVLHITALIYAGKFLVQFCGTRFMVYFQREVDALMMQLLDFLNLYTLYCQKIPGAICSPPPWLRGIISHPLVCFYVFRFSAFLHYTFRFHLVRYGNCVCSALLLPHFICWKQVWAIHRIHVNCIFTPRVLRS